MTGLALAGLVCSREATPERVVYLNSLDTMASVLTKSGTSLDSAVSRDGRGSIRIDAAEPTTVRLAEVQTADAENATLIYRAHLRSRDLQGQAYLEMWAGIPGKGEFFSRALESPLSGTTEWVSQQTPFFLAKGQRAQTVKLNVVVNGKGTLWIDDLSLALAEN
jgi:hypothetical protein